MTKKLTALLMSMALLGSMAAECEVEPRQKPTIVVKTPKPRKKINKKGTPAIEYTCYENLAGKRICRRK